MSHNGRLLFDESHTDTIRTQVRNAKVYSLLFAVLGIGVCIALAIIMTMLPQRWIGPLQYGTLFFACAGAGLILVLTIQNVRYTTNLRIYETGIVLPHPRLTGENFAPFDTIDQITVAKNPPLTVGSRAVPKLLSTVRWKEIADYQRLEQLLRELNERGIATVRFE